MINNIQSHRKGDKRRQKKTKEDKRRQKETKGDKRRQEGIVIVKGLIS